MPGFVILGNPCRIWCDQISCRSLALSLRSLRYLKCVPGRPSRHTTSKQRVGFAIATICNISDFPAPVRDIAKQSRPNKTSVATASCHFFSGECRKAPPPSSRRCKASLFDQAAKKSLRDISFGVQNWAAAAPQNIDILCSGFTANALTKIRCHCLAILWILAS